MEPLKETPGIIDTVAGFLKFEMGLSEKLANDAAYAERSPEAHNLTVAGIKAYKAFLNLAEVGGFGEVVLPRDNTHLISAVQGALRQAIVPTERGKNGALDYEPDYAKLLGIAASVKDLVTKPAVAQDSLHGDTQAVKTAVLAAATPRTGE